ncbi:MAG: hypothetical protein QM485_09545 [Flavobacteriaceae bacterium]
MNNTSYSEQSAKRIIIILTFLSIGYAVLRYNIMGDVPWKDLPLFVLNKGISLASLLLLTLNFSLSPLKNLGISISDTILNARKSFGVTGFAYAFMHLIISLSIINPVYYPAFFIEEGSFTLRGGLCLLGGVLSFILLWVYYKSFKQVANKNLKINARITSKKSILYILFFLGIHFFFLGYTSWTTVHLWPGGLPPISLISFLIFLLGFLINVFGRKG